MFEFLMIYDTDRTMEPKESVTVTPGNNWIPDQKCANNDNNEIQENDES